MNTLINTPSNDAINKIAAIAIPVSETAQFDAENSPEMTSQTPSGMHPDAPIAPIVALTTDETVDMRLADCASAAPRGWRVGWAQIIGTRHPRLTEDSVGHRSHLSPGQALGSAQAHPAALALAVADGVGGGARGEVASAALVAHSLALPTPLLGHPEAMAEWMALAEAQVQLKLREVSYSPGAATLAAAWLWPMSSANTMTGYVMRVGDARLCCFDGQRLTALTTDQTYTQVGETPPDGATASDPARMVGTGYMGAPELQPFSLSPGQTLLLCSDGLHQGLPPERMAELMRESAAQHQDLAATALNLARAARLAGSEDDITVLLACTDDGRGFAQHSQLRPWQDMFKRIFA